MKNPTADVDCLLGDKLTQTYLMKMIQSKDGQNYIPVFCNAKRIDENSRNMADIRPRFITM